MGYLALLASLLKFTDGKKEIEFLTAKAEGITKRKAIRAITNE